MKSARRDDDATPEPPNNILALRSARGWSQDRLAQEAGTTAGTIQKLESRDMQLTHKWMARLAAALGVSKCALIEDAAPPHPAEPVAPSGMAEDAEAYAPGPGEHLPLEAGGEPLGYVIVTSRALDQVGVLPGDILTIAMSPRAVAAVADGDLVVAQHYSDTDLTHATTILRQYVEPGLLTTNSRADNARSLALATDSVAIKGVVRELRRAPRRDRRPRP